MATTFNFGTISVPNTPTVIGPQTIPAGINSAQLNMDVKNMTTGQVLWMKVEHNNGSGWVMDAYADFDGPYKDKTGQTTNTNSLFVTFGSVGEPPQPILSQTGWQVRATVWAVNGPISIPSGSIIVS